MRVGKEETMSFASPLVWLSLMMSLFFLLLPVALLVVLQVWLCRKSRKLGLILPVLSLVVSLLLVLSLGVFQRIGGGAMRVTDEYGNVVQEEYIEAKPITPGDIGALAGMFLVSNIPTVVFGGIWLYYKNRRDFKDDLKRMKIEDLE